MKTFLRFLLLGLLTAAVGEWQFSVFLRSDLRNFFGSLGFNALYLTGVYLLTRPMLSLLRKRLAFLPLYTALFGFTGLMVEWFLIGNSPWGNPQASQVGMFAYWACMALVPLMFLLQRRSVQGFIVRYGLVYIVLVLLGQSLIADSDWRFAFHIYSVILGYAGLMLGVLMEALPAFGNVLLNGAAMRYAVGLALVLFLLLSSCAAPQAPSSQPATALFPTLSPIATSILSAPSLPAQGLAGPAAPPAPETECANRIVAEANSWVFECATGSQNLRYRYTPETGSLHDLMVETGGLPPFWPSFFGGPIFVFGDREIPIWSSETLIWSHTEPRLTPDGLEITWQAGRDEQQVAYTYRFSIHGKTLRIAVEATGGLMGAFSLDRSEATPGARILSIPYLATFDLLFYEGLFVSLYFDWIQSAASRYEKVSLPYSERSFHFSQMAFYELDTAGVRLPLREVIYLTVSDRLADVLPVVPNLPSPYRETLTGHTLIDIWTEAPFSESQALIEELHRRGVRDLLVIRHTWQRCGYDDCYPSILPARAEWGGDEGLRNLAEAARQAGYLFAVHENYTDFYPNADIGSPEDLALDSEGRPRPAWFNQTTGLQSHLLSPFRALDFARQISPDIHRRYGTTAAFVDVLTAVPPWEKTDYHARYPNRARFLPVFRAYSEVLDLLRATHAGPVIGEGGAHFLYAGLVDGVAAAYQPDLSQGGWRVPPLVDFALLRLHPLMVSYGVGYFPYYFAQDEQPRWSGYTLEDHYHYMATEIAFCHAGYVDSPELFDSAESWLAWAEREARLVGSIHRLCASARPVTILYRVNGELVPVERAVAAGQLEQILIEYNNGLQVYVNRHPIEFWSVELNFRPSWADFSAMVDGARQDFVGVPQTASFLLPPSGWLAVMP
ncbi:MAG: DUF5696 domain-containing protein [Anaerolineales bacterium]|nr:DUF5696 domain-containing protein [Anaerolineales bacterium]